jgi:integrase
LGKKGSGTLPIEQTLAQKKVRDFLNSSGRNSSRTSDLYQIGLARFQTYLNNDNDTLENIVTKIIAKQLDVYSLLDNFVSYLSKLSLSARSIILYVKCVKSYLQYHDIDISPNKFKHRVKLPKNYNNKELAIDAEDIRAILKSCNHIRIKAILYVLASTGIRITECLMIRNKDIDFKSSPTKITIRAEYAKTRTERDVYISDEATNFVKEWIDWKYRDRIRKDRTPAREPNDLVFSGKFVKSGSENPRLMYRNVLLYFHRILKNINMDEKNDGGVRNKITIHSFRRFVYTTICSCENQGYAEGFLGHAGSVYHTMKEEEKKQIYALKIMKHLTFLDFTGLETTEKNIEAKLEAKDREYAHLREMYDESLRSLNLLSAKYTLQSEELRSQSERLSKLERQQLENNVSKRK